MRSFKIGNREIGLNSKPLVIAEIGINHGGSLAEAIKIAAAAIDAGAEVIKHQTHVVDDEMSHHAKKVKPSHCNESIYEIMESCALSEVDEKALMEYVESRGSIFISTPFSRAAADRLQRMNVKAYKIGSGECNNYPLIEHIATFGKPVILSTGMNHIDSIKKSVEILRSHNVPFALLHCTNVYPTPYEFVRLGGMTQLADAFPDAVIGLSDHTIDNYACLGAVALGACILERHFTDTLERRGPDISCSMDPLALSELIRGSAIIKQCRGGEKGPIDLEKGTIAFAFASVVTTKKVAKGELYTKENLWVKRPGSGFFKAESYEQILGKRATRDLDVDVQLEEFDI